MAKKKPRSVVDEIASGLDAEAKLRTDAEIARLKADLLEYKGKYSFALKEIERQKARADNKAAISGVSAAKAVNSAGKGRSSVKTQKHSASALLMLSDVHCEERVRPETVNGDNDFSLEVCDQRMQEVEDRFLSCLDHESAIVNIGRIVVWLGGDFITGHIHPDCVETAQLSPTNATRWVQARLRRMLNRISPQVSEVVVITNSGNHGRTTEKQRIATELEHSYEQLMYHTMAEAEPCDNIRWQIAEGHLGYLDLDGFTLRHLHGHSIRYNGGVLGIALPASKAIAAWDAHRRADLTIFGHYHTWGWLRGARYCSNGSVIGHSPYGTFVKVTPERPCQGFAVIDHERNEVTRAYPLFCDRDLRKAGR